MLSPAPPRNSTAYPRDSQHGGADQGGAHFRPTGRSGCSVVVGRIAQAVSAEAEHDAVRQDRARLAHRRVGRLEFPETMPLVVRAERFRTSCSTCGVERAVWAPVQMDHDVVRIVLPSRPVRSTSCAAVGGRTFLDGIHSWHHRIAARKINKITRLGVIQCRCAQALLGAW